REYNSYKIRKFDLDSFTLNKSVLKFDKKIDVFYDVSRKAFHLLQHLYRRKNSKPLELGPEFLIKSGLIYSGIDAFENPQLKRKTLYLYGYFQDVNIVDPIREVLISEFAYKGNISKRTSEYLKLIKQNEHSIGISIRCGKDYVESGWPVCGIDYYKKGLEILKQRYSDCKVFIFADDIVKVKNDFGFGDNVIYIEGCSALESLELLKNCSDFVISNSSFAWWGAYLSQNQDKMVIMPEKWFVGLKTKDTSLPFGKHVVMLD
ncbi:alpha-1,2-fucosyltransferase, partial [Gottfriedia acidiceleris]|uniref:alpha-1,2-fucosyltransferase n=1 Tax=Gottfriedia acidiceleris TaxID=371036 RepID=UPI003000E661